ncbi:type VII secretion target [Amycolatopsis sp. NPDC049868]|uniref:type VII secretion target n=1 Tax=Amycolatopsis sp. NPDC049868 TaxID=3363934 RepID=UPI00378C8E92
MAGKGFELGADLDAHAKQIDGIADGLRTAVDAAQQVSMPTDAYGIICQPFRMMLDPVEEFGINALNKAVEAATAVANNVRSASNAYQTQDENFAAEFKNVQVPD